MPQRTPQIYTIGVCGSANVYDDDWFHANIRGYYNLFHIDGNEGREKWLVCADMRNTSVDTLHGYPNCERIKFSHAEDNSWKTLILPTGLKSSFVSAVECWSKSAKYEDKLVIVIVGHGHATTGGVALGLKTNHKRTYHRYLDIEPFLRNLHASKAKVLLVVDACYSGKWIDCLERINHTSPAKKNRGRIKLIVRCQSTEEVLSFGKDGEDRTRGGFFANFFAESLYQEFGINFPRPHDPHATNPFPAHNIRARESDDQATMAFPFPSSLREIVQRACRNIRRASSVVPVPLLKEVNISERDQSSALECIGLKRREPLKLRIQETVAPSPPKTGGHEEDKDTKKGSLLRVLEEYDLLVPKQDPRRASEVAFESLRCRALRQQDESDILQLKIVAQERLNLYLRAKSFAKKSGFELPQNTRTLKSEEEKHFLAHSKAFDQFIHRRYPHPDWCLVLNLVVIGCTENRLVPPLPVKRSRGLKAFFFGLGGSCMEKCDGGCVKSNLESESLPARFATAE